MKNVEAYMTSWGTISGPLTKNHAAWIRDDRQPKCMPDTDNDEAWICYRVRNSPDIGEGFHNRADRRGAS